MKLNQLISVSLSTIALMITGATQAGELIAEFKGERAMQTGEFEVTAPWILDWRVSGEYARDMAVDVSLVKAGTHVHMGNVLKVKWAGNGVRMFEDSGRFFFRVDSTLSKWTLKVEQLTPEEAALYTPKGQSKLDY